MSLKCAFTGHRDLQKFDSLSRKSLKDAIDGLIARGVTEFYCGMARGFDMVAAEEIIKIKKTSSVKLVACIPCPDQDKYFTDEEKKKYAYILENSDEIKEISPNYSNGCMLKRNRFMVDSCDVLVCYLKTGRGGTYYTVSYAIRNNKKIIYID